MEPMTEAGRALAARFPFTWTEQTCCPYPHGDDSGPDIHPQHKKATKTEHRPDDILAIEAEAAQRALDGVRRAADTVKVSDDAIHAALNELGNPGTLAEGIVWAATSGFLGIRAVLATIPSEPVSTDGEEVK